MKKLIFLILAFSLLFSLCACKSTEVKVVERIIDGIGEVTVDSYPDIESAERMYNSLSESDKKEVENSSVLFAAKDTFNKLTEGMAAIEAKEAFDRLNLAYTAALNIAVRLKSGTPYAADKLNEQYDIVFSNMKAALETAHAIEEKYGDKVYAPFLKNYYSSMRGLTNFLDTATVDTPDLGIIIEGHLEEIMLCQSDIRMIFVEE